MLLCAFVNVSCSMVERRGYIENIARELKRMEVLNGSLRSEEIQLDFL